jgi:hypothetical protein
MRLGRPKPAAPRARPAGRQRARINTYYRSENQPGGQSPFTNKPTRTGVRIYLFGILDIILISIVLAGLVYSLIVSPHPKVLVNSTYFHSLNEYQTQAAKLFGQVKNRDKITFDSQSISEGMRAKFPEITAANIELPVFSEKPTMRISVAQASLRLNSGGQTYIVDSQGVIVNTPGRLRSAADLPLVTDQSGFTARPGSPILNVGAVSFINTLVAQCRAANVKIASLVLPSVAQEVDLKESGQSYIVKFYLGGDSLLQSGQYLAARNRFVQTSKPPAQYLDVRVAGKVFYK